MTTWELLQKELEYYGVYLINDIECKFHLGKNKYHTQGIIKTLRQLRVTIKEHQKVLLSLWKDVIKLLEQQQSQTSFPDEKVKKLFIFSLKDLSKFLLMFEGLEDSCYFSAIENALNRDIASFTKEQINNLPDYKISIDWIHRSIQRLLYICKLLSFAATGMKNVSKYNIKTARGISGPWANLDLPMLERTYPFEEAEMKGRTKDKEKQRRYRKGLENYNEPGVSEGHYWRELRNEPYAWGDKDNNPYPHRNTLFGG